MCEYDCLCAHMHTNKQTHSQTQVHRIDATHTCMCLHVPTCAYMCLHVPTCAYISTSERKQQTSPQNTAARYAYWHFINQLKSSMHILHFVLYMYCTWNVQIENGQEFSVLRKEQWVSCGTRLWWGHQSRLTSSYRTTCCLVMDMCGFSHLLPTGTHITVHTTNTHLFSWISHKQLQNI